MCMYMWYHVMYVHMLASLRIWSWPLHLWIRWMQCPSSFRPHKIKCNWNLKHVEMLKCVQTKMLRSSFTGTLQRAMSPHSAKSCIICIPTWHIQREVPFGTAEFPMSIPQLFRPSRSCLWWVPKTDLWRCVHHPIIPSSSHHPIGSHHPSCGCAPLMPAVRSSFLSPFPLPSLVVGWCFKDVVWKEFGVMLLLLQCNYKPWPNATRHVFAFSNGNFWVNWVNWVNGFSFALALALVFTSRLKPWAQRDVKTRKTNAIRGVLIWQW